MNTSVLLLCMAFIDTTHGQEKFQFLYNTYKNDMLMTAYSIVNDFDYAEDAVQTAFCKLIRVIDRIDMNKNPQAFLITMAKNEAKNILKKIGRESTNLYMCNANSLADNMNIEKEAEDRDMVEYISRYIMSLSPKYTDVFMMRCLHEMPYKDISELLDVDESTLRKRMDRLRDKILNKISEESDDRVKQTSNTK